MKRSILFVVCALVCLTWAFEMSETHGAIITKRINTIAQSRAKVHYSSATGTAHLVTETKTKLSKRLTYSSVEEGLTAFLADHPEIGIKNPKSELVELIRQPDAQVKGWMMIMYGQVHKGLRVNDIVFKILVNANNQVVSSAGFVVPDLHLLNVVPSITSDYAVKRSLNSVPEDMIHETVLTELLIHRTELENGRSGSNHLVYKVTFKDDESGEEYYVLIDAHTAEILLTESNIKNALQRTVTQVRVKVLFKDGTIDEPDGEAATMVVNMNELMYNAMMNIGGWDGWLLNGERFFTQLGLMTGFYKRAGPCPNAFWYSERASLCTGLERAYDVLAHEWGHAYVTGLVGGGNKSSAGLTYRGQSGALNEGFSDIIGETMQQLSKFPVEYPPRTSRDCNLADGDRRWIMGDTSSEEILQKNAAGQLIGLRDMYNPNCYENPVSVDDKFVVCDPNVDKGGVHYNSGIPAQVYSLFVDGGEFQGTTYTGVGLQKAFHIFMRGLAKHVPATTFAQHVDFVSTACTELVDGNTDLVDLITGQPTGTVVTAEDCSTLAALYTATKMDQPMCEQQAAGILLQDSQEVDEPIVVDGPFPPLVMNVGEDLIIWSTEDFLHYENVYCRIEGYESYEGGLFESEWEEFVYCEVPPFDGAGTIQISISHDNSKWFGPYDITVHELYTLNAYGPTSGPIEGGNSIRITGEGFIGDFKSCNPDIGAEGQGCAVCYFGYEGYGATVPATIESPTSARCDVPSWESLGYESRTIEVWLSMNYFIAVGPLPYEYQEGVGPVGDVPLTEVSLAFPPNSAPVASVRKSEAQVNSVALLLFAVIAGVATMV